MKKRVLFYLTVITSVFSLQSCVTNYVASAPTLYQKEYKSDAKVQSLEEQRLEANKKILMNSFASETVAKAKSANAAVKNAHIATSIKITQKVDQILDEAQTYLGTPYRYGGMTRRGIDCSAFVLSVFGSAAGITLPRVAAAQSQEGERVEKSELQRGDLLFFSQGKGRISHVGIVESVSPEGDIKFIHAASSRGVMISTLNTDRYWSPRFRFAKRIVTADYVNMTENLAMNKPATTNLN